MASRVDVEPEKLLGTLKDTVFKGASQSELLALVVVSNEYGLNPFLKEIYAFPAKGGGIVPVVSIDGWIRIINRQEGLNGMEFSFENENGKPVSCTCTIHIKDRSHPVVVTEYYEECFRSTDPWKQMPRRMLRHKALIQCARVAFGFSGIYDEDEGERIKDAEATVVASRPLFDEPAKDVEVKVEPVRQGRKKRPQDDPEFIADTAQKRILNRLSEEGVSEADYIKFLNAAGVRVEMVSALSDSDAEKCLAGFENDIAVVMEKF